MQDYLRTGEVVPFWSAHRRSRSTKLLTPLAREIYLALEDLGGAAHRAQVVAAVAASRARAGVRIDGALAAEVAAEFERLCCADPSDLCDWPFYRPFGASSLRWAVSPAWRERRDRGPGALASA